MAQDAPLRAVGAEYTSGLTAAALGSKTKCRSDLLDPEKITSINFHGAASICRSEKCLGDDIVDCKVHGWSDSGKPYVTCQSDFLPPGYKFQYAQVHCTYEEKCIVKNTCQVEYKLTTLSVAEGRNNRQDHYDRRRYPNGGFGSLAMFLLCICLSKLLANRGYSDAMPPLGRGFGYHPYGGYGFNGYPYGFGGNGGYGGFGGGLATGALLGYGLGSSRDCGGFGGLGGFGGGCDGGGFGGSDGGGGFTSGVGHGSLNAI
ncbi:uncharacterized protein LOC108864922 [Galendromus occidentalis]|uniref:Uncharacterized protein LOC108864922 n=1 Tax=Galendromus occidentalis TaxID=34638 RepID=A0AAJ7L621_9ACAR|nr:uncharacterized protein LOC108864922 [Galendromus occidentalis]